MKKNKKYITFLKIFTMSIFINWNNNINITYLAVYPPSISNEVPVIIDAASEAKNTAVEEISDISANLPSAILSNILFLNFLS
jgi:hypothetical protein